MHRINRHYSVRIEHVSGVSEPRPIPGRPNGRQFDVFLIGGQVLEIVATEEEATAAVTGLIRAIDGG